MPACPVCPASVAPGAPFCTACGVKLRFDKPGEPVAVPPRMARGNLLFSWDFRAVAPPGCAGRTMRWPRGGTLDPHPAGVLHAVAQDETATLCDPAVRLRDGCVRLACTAIDPGARVGVALRHEPIGEARIVYVLDVVGAAGTVFLARLIVAPGASDQTALSTRHHVRELRPVGQPNEIELRADGGWLVGYVNGVPVVSAYDPAYGIGAVGVRVGREPGASEPQSRALLHEASVFFLGGGS